MSVFSSVWPNTRRFARDLGVLFPVLMILAAPRVSAQEGLCVPQDVSSPSAKQVWRVVDTDQDCFLSAEEIEAHPDFVFVALDANDDDQITWAEFYKIFDQYKGLTESKTSVAATRFEIIDKDRDGVITRDETLDSSQNIFRALDMNHDDRVSLEEYLSFDAGQLY